MFQFYNLIPSLTARENVALVTEIVEHPMTAGRGARPGRPRAAPRSLSRAAFGGRAAARGDRARHRQAAGRAALRRADRRARHHHRHRRPRGARARQPRTRHRDRRHHAQRGHRGHGRPGRSPGGRPVAGSSGTPIQDHARRSSNGEPMPRFARSIGSSFAICGR